MSERLLNLQIRCLRQINPKENSFYTSLTTPIFR